MSVVNAHLNDLPVKFSVCVNEGQDKLPTMYWLPKLQFKSLRGGVVGIWQRKRGHFASSCPHAQLVEQPGWSELYLCAP